MSDVSVTVETSKVVVLTNQNKGDKGDKGDTGDPGTVQAVTDALQATAPTPLQQALKTQVSNTIAGQLDARIASGTGSPVGVVNANVGTLYTDTAATNGARVWYKATGTGNTGWVVADGDTGSRIAVAWANDVVTQGTMPTGMVPSAGATGGIYWRRIGVNITLSIVGADVTADGPTIPIPAQFDPGGVPYDIALAVAARTNVLVAVFSRVGASSVFSGFKAGDRLADGSNTYATVLKWDTRRPWPTALPGTAG